MIKALTIDQPYASLLVSACKRFETRCWSTNYRGPVAIHASQKDPCKMPLLGRDAFRAFVEEDMERGRIPSWCLLPFGGVIAIAELYDVWSIESGENGICAVSSLCRNDNIFYPDDREKEYGLWKPGNYAWEFRNIRILKYPFHCRGFQRLWNFDEKLLEGYNPYVLQIVTSKGERHDC